ncbi:YfjI family protein [Deferrisoma camini]|uniref:YfjI family protein n=1 Tax=Deferrisoma camini TaxID=1035120 RepID=UPI0004BB4873|nr:YfjI family protein [Deferrisoma camini]
MSASEAARSILEAPVRALPDPEPLPPELPPVPALEPVMLPEGLRPWLEDSAERTQIPLDFLGAGALVVLGATVGRTLAIRPKARDDWTVVPNLWGAVIGRPGLLKSPALAEVMRPLHRLEAQEAEEHAKALHRFEATVMVADESKKAARERIRKAARQGDLAAAEALALDAVSDLPEPPVRRRFVTSDPTVEKLGELLASNPRGVLIFRDELVGFLRSLDREGREGARAFFLEAWNGTGRFTFDRIGRGTVEIEAACVSILGGIQPGPLSQYLRATLAGGAGDDGLLQRFQVTVWPDPPKSWRNVDRLPDSRARDAAFGLFERLAHLDPAQVEAEPGEPPFLRFDATAQEVFDAWRAELERRLRVGTEADAFEAHLAKYRSLVPSLALLLHLADGNTGPVGEVAVVGAVAWADYLEAHARRLYGVALDPALAAARELDRRIRRGDLPDVFTAREVYRKCWRLLDVDGTRAALDYLVDLGRVFEEPVDTGGRPSVRYRAHPALVGGGR